MLVAAESGFARYRQALAGARFRSRRNSASIAQDFGM
jgi:hypothetical protein